MLIAEWLAMEVPGHRLLRKTLSLVLVDLGLKKHVAVSSPLAEFENVKKESYSQRKTENCSPLWAVLDSKSEVLQITIRGSQYVAEESGYIVFPAWGQHSQLSKAPAE